MTARCPRIHFTPEIGWINDPNGLVFHNGEYHLFYQYHPHSTVWGPMHWGHAISRDLLTWQHLPIALAPDALGTIFSGSAIVDYTNTAGFGAGAMVAIFTHQNSHAAPRQSQSLAYSLDDGRTWTKHVGNPVLVPQDVTPDFRDPKVFWYATGDASHWVMALAVAKEIRFYTSHNLKDWAEASRFGADAGSHAGVWECPELVELAIEGSNDRRWVLIVSANKGAPAGGSGVQYFVGKFDGHAFVCDDPPERVRWVDYGADFYAPQAWNGGPDGRTRWIAWMNNWSYGRQIPDAGGRRGAMTLPRELSLRRDGGDIGLVQRPVLALDTVGAEVVRWQARVMRDESVTVSADASLATTAHDLNIGFHIPGENAVRSFGLRLVAANDQALDIRYETSLAQLAIDRTDCARDVPGFAAVHRAPLAVRNGRLALRVLIDLNSIELFADGGGLALTEQYFFDAPLARLELFAEDGEATVEHLLVKSIQ